MQLGSAEGSAIFFLEVVEWREGEFGGKAFFDEEVAAICHERMGIEEGDDFKIEMDRFVGWIEVDDIKESAFFEKTCKCHTSIEGENSCLLCNIEGLDVVLETGEWFGIFFDECGVRGAPTEGLEAHRAAASEEI
jgi:hypothetical protein